MSFKEDDLRSHATADLTPQQLAVLDDWETKFTQAKKYPIIGNLVD
jgi:hypothetical protein